MSLRIKCRDSQTICRIILLLICASLVSACSSTEPPILELPTLVRFPTLTLTSPSTETPLVSETPTITVVPSVTVPNVTVMPSPTITNTVTPIPTDTVTPTQVAVPTVTATALPETFIFGQSAEGRNLVAYRYGTGRLVLMLIGGIHAGFEANTIDLVSRLQVHFRNNGGQIDRELSIILVPSLNPDGAARGRVLNGRFNGNTVDLNRNWGCGWSVEAEFGQGRVDPGEEAFSEPESTALGSLIQRMQPAAVIFYHAAANGVFAGDCGDSTADSDGLAAIYGEVSGYPYGSDFDDYNVTGTAPGWVHSIGIPALDVELATSDSAEFERNLRAIMTIQDWLVGR